MKEKVIRPTPFLHSIAVVERKRLLDVVRVFVRNVMD